MGACPTPSFLGEEQQGCPLSPLLYALAAEPLSISLRSHPNIRGLRSGSLVESVGMFADCMILYVEDTGSSYAALQVLEKFEAHSVLCINWGILQILPLDSYPPSCSAGSYPLNRVAAI